MDIIRFVDPETACFILGKNSSYLFRSLEHYKDLERYNGDTEVGDRFENLPAINQEGTTHTYTALGQHLVSCWAIINSATPQASDWKALSTYAGGVAIVSTVTKVENFLTEIVDLVLGRTWSLNHEKVKYYNEDEIPGKMQGINAPFYKRKRYEKQKEYRFALQNGFDLLSNNNKVYIKDLLLTVEKPDAYIDRVYFSPTISKDQKEKVIQSAYLGRNRHLLNNDG